MTSEAAALTEQIAGLLAEHEFIPAYHGALSGRCKGCHPPELENMMGTAVHRRHVAEVLAARLADSRPVVSEAAIQAAAEALFNEFDSHHSSPRAWTYAELTAEDAGCTEGYRVEAHIALTAALPHMGDGKGEAESCDVCGLTGHTCGGQPA